jgi:hypothetical protein
MGQKRIDESGQYADAVWKALSRVKKHLKHNDQTACDSAMRALVAVLAALRADPEELDSERISVTSRLQIDRLMKALGFSAEARN